MNHANLPALFKMTTPLGEGYEIPYHDIGPKDQAPAVALVGGIHGNELNSIFALARLAAVLHPIEQGKKSGRALTQRVLIVPAVNIFGMHTRQRLWPFDRTDINRMFPGYAAGETTQRIADAVFQLTRQAPVRVDIHSSNLEIEELPQVRVYDTHAATLASARLFGLPAVIECPVNKIASATLLHAWMALGGENFVIQGGLAGDLQKHHGERILSALLRFLVRRKILTGTFEESETQEDTGEAYTFRLRQTVSLVSEKAGLFVAQTQIGRWIEKGELLGIIYDGFNGQVRARIKAPVSGLLTALRRQALLYQGDLLARIQSRTPVEEGADTYLIGLGQ